MLSGGFDQKSCDGATSSTNEHSSVDFASAHRGQKSLCHQPPVDFSILSRHDWNTIQIVGRDRVVLLSICRAPTHRMFPEEGKEMGRWHLPPGNYVTPPAEEAASSCSQRDSPSPLPDTEPRAPVSCPFPLFRAFVPPPGRPTMAPVGSFVSAGRKLLRQDYKKISVAWRDDKALIDVAHSYGPSTSRPRPLPPYPSSALCKNIFKYSHYSREISLSRLCNVSKSLAALPHQSRLSGTVRSCSS